MEGRLFDLEIVTPERIFYRGKAWMVELNTTEGEIGVYKNHIPTVFVLAPGILNIKEEGAARKAALYSGFMEVQKERITILAETAEWPEEIDVARAKKSQERAKRRLEEKTESVDVKRAEASLKRAMVRLNLAGRER